MKRGEITVFLSLVFILLLSFVMGILQVSVIQSSKSLSRLAVDRAVYSLFGEYHQELLKSFHVFAIDGSYGTGQYEEDNLIRRMHYYGTENTDHQITAVQYLTDNGGQAFREQVLEYMEQKYGVSLIKGFTGMTSKWEEEEIQGEKMQETQDQIKEQIESLTDGGAEGEALNESGENPFSCLEQIEKNGILSIVMPEEMTLSGRMIELEQQASYRSLRHGRGSFPARTDADGPTGKLLFDEYILRKFQNAAMKEETEQQEVLGEEDESDSGKEKEKSLNYEVEYILSGKASDKENLEAVLMKIFLIRMAMNYSFLYGDSEKQNEAQAIAAVVSTILLIPEASEAIKQAVLAAWAAGESIMDLRALLSGKRAAVSKSAESWQLSASALFRLGSDEDSHNGYDAEGGMTYEDYLRILLFLTDTEAVTMRTIDRVEENLVSDEKGRIFLADQCITKIEIMNTAVIYGEISYEFPVCFAYQ